MKKLLAVSLLTFTLVFSSAPFAQAVTLEELQAQLASLMAQIAALQAGSTPVPTVSYTPLDPERFCFNFERNLKIGDGRNSFTEPMVQALQTALEKEGFFVHDNDKKGGSVFGESTASAVTAFQQKYADEILYPNGLSYGNGFVGASTRAKLNALYGCNRVNPGQARIDLKANNSDGPIRVNPGSEVVLSWERENILMGCQVSAKAGKVITQVPATGGAGVAYVYPTQDTQYVIGCDKDSANDNVLVYATPVSVPISPTLLGDVNLDGVVNIIDAQQLSRYLSGLTQLNATQLANADVNRDGRVSSADIDLIAQGTVGIRNLNVMSPNGGESYVSGEGSISVIYSASGIEGQPLTAYLYSPVYNNIRTMSVGNAVAGKGSFVMDLVKGGVDPVGQYKIKLCADRVSSPESGKNLCDSSDNYFNLSNSSPKVPQVSLTSAKNLLTVGERPVLSWSATNQPAYCSSTSSGPMGSTITNWNGAGPTNYGVYSGTNSNIGPLNVVGTYTFTMVCSNSAGSSEPISAVIGVYPSIATQPISVLTPSGGETYKAGDMVNIRWTGSDNGWSNHDLYVLDNRAAGFGIQKFIGTASLTAKDVQVFSWIVPSDLTSGFGYQIAFGNSKGSNAAGFSGAFGINQDSTATAAPIVTLSAYPTTINAGQSSTLSLSSQNAATCTGNADGLTKVTPSVTTVYTYSCTNSAGTTSKSVTVVVNGSSGSLLGDVNLDGAVNVIDAQQISRYLAKRVELNSSQLLNADVNKDGQVTSADMNLISEYSVGIITSFPSGSANGANAVDGLMNLLRQLSAQISN